jgi:hypothetical protein
MKRLNCVCVGQSEGCLPLNLHRYNAVYIVTDLLPGGDLHRMLRAVGGVLADEHAAGRLPCV